MSNSAEILIVEDSPTQAMQLQFILEKNGYRTSIAKNGEEALVYIKKHGPAMIISDILMPVMDGYRMLEHLKADPKLRHIPVVVISAVDDLDSAVKCIELGADDYLPKPFNEVLLKARVGACLEKKSLYEKEKEYLNLLEIEQAKSERLLLNVLPGPIADRLRQKPGAIADGFEDISVLFADIVDFTKISARRSPGKVVGLLNEIFSGFDLLAEKYGLEKIKTIGDSYMVVGGLPTPRTDHAEAVAEMALDMQVEISRFTGDDGQIFRMRTGINTGPVVAGVIGRNKFIYDLWGDTVNTASRMESQGLPGCIQVTRQTYERLRGKYLFEERGVIHVKGKGEMPTYLLLGRKTRGGCQSFEKIKGEPVQAKKK